MKPQARHALPAIPPLPRTSESVSPGMPAGREYQDRSEASRGAPCCIVVRKSPGNRSPSSCWRRASDHLQAGSLGRATLPIFLVYTCAHDLDKFFLAPRLRSNSHATYYWRRSVPATHATRGVGRCRRFFLRVLGRSYFPGLSQNERTGARTCLILRNLLTQLECWGWGG